MYLHFLVAFLLPASLSHRSTFWTLRLLDDLCCGDGKLTFICCIFWVCAVFGSSLEVTRSGFEWTHFSSYWATTGNSSYLSCRVFLGPFFCFLRLGGITKVGSCFFRFHRLLQELKCLWRPSISSRETEAMLKVARLVSDTRWSRIS